MRVAAHRLALALSLAWGPSALAQEEVCSGQVNLGEFAAAMDLVDAAIEQADVDEARYLLQQVHPKVPCLNEPATAVALVRYGLLRATVAFFDQDEVTATRWARFAVYADEDGDPWPEDIPPTHPIREMLEFALEPGEGGPPMGLEVPKKGGMLLNGKLILQPRWYTEVPGLLQVFDKKLEPVDGAWIDGTAFPERFLRTDPSPVDPPRWWEEPLPETVAVELPDGSELPTESADEGPNITRLAIGGGAAVLAGSLYLVAASSTSGLEQASSEEELAAARSRVNLLVLGSGLTGAAALGIGITAFVHDGPGVGIRGRF